MSSRSTGKRKGKNKNAPSSSKSKPMASVSLEEAPEAPMAKKDKESEIKTTDPQVSEPKADKPQVSWAKVTGPQVSEHEETKPEVSESKATEAQISEHKATKPEISESKAADPQVSKHKATKPEVSESKTTDPQVSEPKAPRPQVSQSKAIRTINPEDLGMQFKRKLSFTKFAERPGFGTLGKRIKLVSNCFNLKVPSGCVYHYDVTITRKSPEVSSAKILAVDDDKKYRCLSTKRNREVIKLMLATNPIFNNVYAVYDGQKNIYTRDVVRGSFPIKCEVVMPDEDENLENPRQEVYIVHTKPAYKEDGSCAISLDTLHAFYNKQTSSVPQETIMALETILRQGPCLQFTPVGRSFFYPPNPNNLHPLGGGLEIWFGYHQSVRLGQWGPMVNMNHAATSFFQAGSVIAFIADILRMNVSELRRKPGLQPTEIKKLTSKLQNLKVEVTHLKNFRRKYRVVRVTKERAHRLEFEMTENNRLVKKTVADYFRQRYGRSLEFPNLPCLHVKPEKKHTYLPIEVCEIVSGQHNRRKVEGPQLSQMIRFTAAAPKDRFAKIKEIAENADFSNDSHVRRFGVEVSKVPIKCEGRVLDSPTVRYKDGEIKPVEGSWRQKKFFTGAAIKSWVLICFVNIKLEKLRPFNDLLIKTSKELGILINQPKYVNAIDPSRCDIKSLLLEMKNKYQADLAVIVLPINDKIIYGKVKQAAETIVGLSTQCIKENNVTDPKRSNYQLVSNLCMKINAKCGGENNTLVFKEMPPVLHKPVIIIGADVNHPGVTDGVKPSLAACVCSLDMKLSKYAVSVRAQMNMDEKKQALEIIVDLKNMVLDLLKAFYQYTKGKKPEKILFYRDGVSEGQFDKVHDHEVRCIREACKSLPGQYEPGITFILVQKRHHIRFMPEDINQGAGHVKNIPPGTTVDRDVTDPTNYDFYLCSHLGLKGTSRPSHYIVLEDDNKFSPDDLQKITYQLCHTYARCSKSISIPVPVAYADLAAYRARQHLEVGLEDASTSSDSSGGSDSTSLPTSIVDSINVAEELKKAMYFV